MICSFLRLPILPPLSLSLSQKRNFNTHGNLSGDSEYLPPDENNFNPWTTSDYEDFCRELNLSKSTSIKCLRMLKSDPDFKNKLSSIKNHHIKKRNNELVDLFQITHQYTYCSDINSLLENLTNDASSKKWSLFIDFSKRTLKAALICELHEYPSIPIVHARVKEDRRSVLRILELIKNKEKNWPIISDLKVMNFLLGFPSGCAKHPCCYFFFDTRNCLPDFDKNISWPIMHIGEKESISLNHYYFSLLHIKLGLFHKFVKLYLMAGNAFNIWFK